MTQATAFQPRGFKDGLAYPIRNSQGYKDWAAQQDAAKRVASTAALASPVAPITPVVAAPVVAPMPTQAVDPQSVTQPAYPTPRRASMGRYRSGLQIGGATDSIGLNTSN